MAKANKPLLSRHDMKNLPNVNGDEFKENCAIYTELVFTKVSKEEAFKMVFKDKYEKIIRDSNGSKLLEKALLSKGIQQLERTKFMQECFYTANKHWWMKFLGKKHDIFEKLYNDAMDDSLEVKDRHSASKIFLGYVPDAPKEDKVTVEIKVGSDEFKDMLAQKKRQLYMVANDSNEDIIEVNVNE